MKVTNSLVKLVAIMLAGVGAADAGAAHAAMLTIRCHKRWWFRIAPFVVVAFAFASLANIASADVTKADNTTNLNVGASWVGGVVPTAADTMIVDTTLTGNRTAALGSNVSVLGITARATNTLTINNTAGATLTIGSGGISATNSGALTFNNAVSLGGNIILANAAVGALGLNGGITLTADSIWSMGGAAANDRINIGGTINTGGHTLTISSASAGNGIFNIQANNTLGTEVTIGTFGFVYVQGGATVTFNCINNTHSFFSMFGGTANIASMGTNNGASSIGKGSANVNGGNTLNYTGNTFSSDKGFNGIGNSANSTINVTTAGQTLSMSGTLVSSAGSGGWVFGGAGNLTLSGVIPNAVGFSTVVTKSGAGTLTLAATNTYAGGTIISNGVVFIRADNNLGTSAGSLTFAGGTLETTNSFILSRVVTNTADGKFNIDQLSTLTVTNLIVGDGGLTKSGPGTLVLNAANTYTGPTAVSNGTLLVNGTHTGGGTYTVDAGTTLGGSGTVNSAVAVSSGGYLAPGGAVRTIGMLTLGSTLALSPAYLAFDLTSDTTPGTTYDRIAVTSTMSMTGDSIIQLYAPSGLIATGTYMLITFDASTVSTFVFPNGTTNMTIGSSTLNLQNGTTNLQLIVSGADASLRLKWNGPLGSTVWDTTTTNWFFGTNASVFTTGDHVMFDDSASTFTVTGTGSPASVIFSNTSAYDVSAIIGGSGAMVSKSGSGTVTLSGSNTFGGGVTINGGTVKYGAATNLGASGAVTLDGGTLAYTSTPGTALSSVTVNGGNGTILATNLSSGPYLTVNSLNGAGTLTFTNVSGQWDSGLILAGMSNNGFSGRIVVSHAGFYGFLKFTNEAVLGTYPDALTLNASTLLPISGTLTLNTHTLTITNGAAFMGNTTVNTKITGSGLLTIQGTLTLGSTANDYTGDLRIYGDGSILKLGADNVIPHGVGKGNIMFSYGVTLDMNGKSVTINALTDQYAGNKSIDIVSAGGSSTLTVGDNNAVGTFPGNIRNTTGILSLTKIGTNTLTLSGTNTYSGATTVSNGTLALTGNGTLGGSNIIIAAGATLRVTGLTNGSLVLSGSQSLSGDGVFAGALNNDGVIAPGSASPGTLTVNGSYAQTNGTLNIRIASGVNGLLSVTNTAAMGGTLKVTLESYTPAPNDVFVIVMANSITGNFTTTNLPSLATGEGWLLQSFIGSPSFLALSVTGAPSPSATGYDLYAQAITNGQTAYNQSATGDGYPNLLKYVTGSSPTQSDTLARMDAARVNGVLSLIFNHNTSATDATLIVEGAYSSTNDATWNGIATNIAGSWGGATNVVENTATNPASVTVSDTVGPSTNRFLRLRVTRP